MEGTYIKTNDFNGGQKIEEEKRKTHIQTI